MTEQLSPLALQALAVVEESGAIINANHAHPHTIRHKGRIDLVTETDIAVEAFLKERLATLAPQAGFLAEESAEDLSLPDTCWIIDPVDGTTNFAHGLPLTVTSVAYRLNGEIVLGIVNAPLLRECFIAEKGKGAWRNGERISVSSVTACENALIATGFPYEIASRVDEILESDVGTKCGVFDVRQIGDEYFAFIEECEDPKACSVLLRGGSKDALNEIERNLQDAMQVARNVVYDPRLLPGGGVRGV